MSLNNFVKKIQDIMRNDAGVNGDAQRIEQMTWILFLKIYDSQEMNWEFFDEEYWFAESTSKCKTAALDF